MFLVLHGLRCLIVTDLFLDSTRYNVLCRVSAVHSSIVNVINLCLCHSVCSWVIVFVHSLKSVPLICILSLCPTTTSHQTFPSQKKVGSTNTIRKQNICSYQRRQFSGRPWIQTQPLLRPVWSNPLVNPTKIWQFADTDDDVSASVSV